MPTDPIADPELRDLLPKLGKEERAALKKSLKDEGQRDDIIVWLKPDNTRVIVDGYNREAILKELGVKPRYSEMEFASKEQVVDWMYQNALARRSLDPATRAYIIGKDYLREKKRPGGQNGQVGHVDPAKPKERTSAAIARKHKVSEKTVRRSAKFAEAIDAKSGGDPAKRAKLLATKKGKKKAKKGFDAKRFASAYGVLLRGVDEWAKAVGIKDSNVHKTLTKGLETFWKAWEASDAKIAAERKELVTA